MIELWTTLVPLILGSAIVPVQIMITILLLRSPSGRGPAVAWIAGMTAIRLLQGLLAGVVLGSARTPGMGPSEPSTGSSLILLVIAIMFYVLAAKQLATRTDEDAPPPRWMAAIGSATPGRAFLFGFGLVGLGAKSWVFTLGAIAAISTADLGTGVSVVTFLLFVVLAESVHLILFGSTLIAPERSALALDRFAAALARHDRIIAITLGLVFGTWFLVKALRGLGLI